MSADQNQGRDPLAIICCGGTLPFAVADAVQARGREVILFAVEGAADATRVGNYKHRWVAVGQGGRLVGYLRELGCRDLVFIGYLTRPPFWKMRIGISTLFMLPKILASFRGGDNHLLSSLARIAEDYGFHVVAAHDVAPEILVPAGELTRRKPSPGDASDIALGLDLLRSIGPFDIGQAVVVANRHVLAVEGIEGTDEMLGRIADLRRRGRITTLAGTGVLVKAPKPHQDRRFDLPAIGPKTVAAVSGAGLAGIAVLAGEAIAAEPQLLLSAADEAGIFVAGIGASS